MKSLREIFNRKKQTVECRFLQEDPTTFPEVTLDQLLDFKDASLTCDSEDDVWQYYFVKDKDAFVKIKKDIVVRYLDKKDAEKMDTYIVKAEVTIYTKATCEKDAEVIAYNCISAENEDIYVTSIATDIKDISVRQ